MPLESRLDAAVREMIDSIAAESRIRRFMVMKRLRNYLALEVALLCVTLCVAGCASDGEVSGLDNQIRINGVEYDIVEATIFHTGEFRYVALETAGLESLVFHIDQVSSQIPRGRWTAMDDESLCEVSVSDDVYLETSDIASVDVTISGTDGGTLTVTGSLSCESKDIDCAFGYTGAYQYIEN